MAWTSDDLVEAVKRRAQIPDANGSMSDSDILALATEELQTQLVPMIATMVDGYCMGEDVIPVVAGQAWYQVPHLALGGTLYDVILLDSSLRVLGSLPSVQLSEYADYESLGTGHPRVFALSYEHIALGPTPANAGYLRVRYNRRPSRLVPVSDCGRVSSYAADTPTAGRTRFTLTGNAPSSFSSGKIDLWQGLPPFEPWATFCTPSNVSGATFDVASASIADSFQDAHLSGYVDGAPTQVAYWSPAGSTCVVPIPDILHSVLVSAVAAQVLRSIGDFQGAAIEQEQLDTRKQRIVATLAPRSRSDGRVIIASSHPIRAGMRSGRF